MLLPANYAVNCLTQYQHSKWNNTCQVNNHDKEWRERWLDTINARQAIEKFCREHIGQVLEVTCTKDFGMIELWDYRAVQVIQNTGFTLAEHSEFIAKAIASV